MSVDTLSEENSKLGHKINCCSNCCNRGLGARSSTLVLPIGGRNNFFEQAESDE